MPRTEEEKTFDDAFDEAITEKQVDDTSQEDTSVKTDAEDDAQKEVAKEEEVIDDTTTKEEKADSESTVYKPAPAKDSTDDIDDSGAEDYKQLYTDISAELRKNNQKMSSWEGRIRAEKQRADALQKIIDGKKTSSPSTSVVTDDDLENDPELKEFFDDFPDFKKPFFKIASRIAEKQAKKVEKNLSPQISSLQTSAKESAEEAHYRVIGEAHSDWESILNSGKLDSWISAQSPLIQKTLVAVKEQGSAEEIIEMFDTYKDVNPQDNKQTQKKDVSKKAESLMAVQSSSPGPPKGKPDPDNFDSAWDEAISKE